MLSAIAEWALTQRSFRGSMRAASQDAGGPDPADEETR
jgi:hypothetical protein